MKRSLQTCACLITALYLLGGHWGMLQVVAWAQMLCDYSKTETVLTAVQYTFDGNHPCCMCLKIDESRQQEKKDHNALPNPAVEKNTLWMTASDFTPLPDQRWIFRQSSIIFAKPSHLVSQWAAIPDIPPPRV